MSISYIISRIFQYIVPTIIVICLFSIIAGAGYFFLYKKLLKGTKTINRAKIVLSIFLTIYLLVVFGLTCGDRGAGIDRYANLQLFSSYIDAWNTFSVRAWQFIIFNIVMFIPLGILLPLINGVFKKAVWIFSAAFLTSFFIEGFQYLAKLGIFELDDLFHNTLGGMIGYSMYMIGYTIIKGSKNSGTNINNHVKRASAVKFIVLPIAVIMAFCGIFIKYNLQEFGNMPINKVTGADMSKYTIESSVEISDKEGIAPVYKYVHSWDRDFAISQAQKVMRDLNLPAFKSYLIQGEDIFFEFESSSYCSFWWDRSNGSWHYSNHAVKKENKEVILNDDEKYKIAMGFAKGHNISLTNAILESIKGDIITFKINPDVHNEEKWMSGQIVFNIADSGIVSSIRYDVYENDFVRNVDIISPQSAYKKILKGKFNDWWSDMPGGKIEIKDIKISYFYDTKGFYQPVYEFIGVLNGREWNAYIAAMK